MSLAWVLAAFVLVTGPELSKKETRAARELLGDIVRAVDADERSRLADEASRFDELAPAELMAALRAGPLYPKGLPKERKLAGGRETLERFGSVVSGHAFEHDGQRYRYAVDVPEDYDPERAHAVLLDPGHGSGADQDAEGKAEFLEMYRRHADAAGGGDWLVVRTEIIEQVGAGGPRELPEDQVVRIFDAFLRDLASIYHVDPARIYVAGLSQTGFWAWYLGRARADRWAGIAPMSAVTWQVDRWRENLLTLPTYVLHGEQDPTCPVAQPRATCAGLMALGAPVRYDEIARGAHDYGVWQHLPRALTWLQANARESYPRRVSKSLGTDAAEQGGAWCHWLRADAWKARSSGKASWPPAAGIDGELDGQTVRLFSENVERVTLAFAPAMLDLAQPVVVVWNGETVFEGRLETSARTTFAIAGERVDWSVLYAASLTLDAP